MPSRFWRTRRVTLKVLSLLAIVTGLPTALKAQPAVAPPTKDGPAHARQSVDRQAQEDTAEIGDQWVRLAKDAQGQPRALQTATVRYRGKYQGRPIAVDLIGAVHVGDVRYYRQLNKQFRQYDALLYELVAPEGTVIQPGDANRSTSAIGALQNGMSSLLELEHQLSKIDYTPRNFVHADMSPEQFASTMKDRGESFLQMYFRMLGTGIAFQSEQATTGESMDMEIIMAFMSNDRARRLKIAFASQMQHLEGLLGGFGGPDGSTIITERNKAAFRVLRREIAAGKQKLGVFYGAGHLSDMDERLRKDFGLLPEEITWLDAWDLTKK